MHKERYESISQEYYAASIEHRNTHKCGGFPYSNGTFLNAIVGSLKIGSVLEIGTAIGYSAFCFAYKNRVNVITLDMNEAHRDIAVSKWVELGVQDQIECLTGHSKDMLPNFVQQFGIVFFDGFAPDPSEVAEFVRVLNPSGVLISTNLSWNTSTDEYLKKIAEHKLETIRFDDTAFSSLDTKSLETTRKCWEKKHEEDIKNETLASCECLVNF